MRISDFQALTAASLPEYKSCYDRWKAGVEMLIDNLEEAEQLFEARACANTSEEKNDKWNALRVTLGFMLVDLVQMAGAAGIELEGAARENLIAFMGQKKTEVRGETDERILKLAKEIEKMIKEGEDSE